MIKHTQTIICYDCGTPTNDYVMEVRQVSGGDGVIYANDFQNRPVHANRRDCIAAKAKKREEEMRTKDPFYDVEAC